MSDEAQSRLASILAALVGAYVALSPIWTTMSHGSTINVIITGSVIFVASLWQMATKNTLPSWINGIAAIWLVIGALIFGAFALSVWTQIVAGIAVILLARWDSMEIAHYSNTSHLQPSH